MKIGFDVFGKPYGIMFQNDLHDKKSVDYQFIKNMILLDDESDMILYDMKNCSVNKSIVHHELYEFAQQFKGKSSLETIDNVLRYTKNIVDTFSLPFDEMLFGGTEKEIIDRGTDWCTDISRVGCALLQCLEIPCRIVIIVNANVAYNGHTICEALIEEQFLMCDFTYGVCGFLDKPYSVKSLIANHESIGKVYKEVIQDEQNQIYFVGLYNKAAICNYDITKHHNYAVSKPNKYYLKLMNLNHDGTWKLGECVSMEKNCYKIE